MALSLPVSRLIRDNVSVLLTFAFSRASLEKLVAERFEGEFKPFREAAFDFSAQRAEKACLDLALLLRYVDDESGLSKRYVETGHQGFGYVTLPDGKIDVLKLRDVANKIIHASTLRWNFSKWDRPLLVCSPRDGQKWREAEIDVVSLAAACGSLG
jgi:hypothetical protein